MRLPLRSWKKTLSRLGLRSTAASQPPCRTYRPRLERLEARNLLAALADTPIFVGPLPGPSSALTTLDSETAARAEILRPLGEGGQRPDEGAATLTRSVSERTSPSIGSGSGRAGLLALPNPFSPSSTRPFRHFSSSSSDEGQGFAEGEGSGGSSGGGGSGSGTLDLSYPTIQIVEVDADATEPTSNSTPVSQIDTGSFKVEIIDDPPEIFSFFVSLSGLDIATAHQFSDYDVLGLEQNNEAQGYGPGVWLGPQQLSKTFTIVPKCDTSEEPTETASWFITGQGTHLFHYTENQIASVSIADQTPLVTITANGDANERVAAGSPASSTFTITRSFASDQSLSVSYSLGGSASASDYSLSGSAAIPANQTSVSVTVTPTDDSIYEGTETVAMTLTDTSNFNGYKLGSPSSATMNILDGGTGSNDRDPPPTVTVGNWSGAEHDGPALFNVSLSGNYSIPVTVNYLTEPGTAKETGDYKDYVPTRGSLTFLPDQSNSQVVSVDLVNDVLDENSETFSLKATVDASGGNTATGTGTIVDTGLDTDPNSDDPQSSISINDVTVNERDGTATFTVSLYPVSGKTVRVGFATAPGIGVTGASAPGDFYSTSGTLTFAPETSTQTIKVLVKDDGLKENSEYFLVNLSNAVNAGFGGIYPGYGDSQGIGTITDSGSELKPQLSNLDLNPCSKIQELLSQASSPIGVTESGGGSTESDHPVRYADGAVMIQSQDLLSDGFGMPWGFTRTWTNAPNYAPFITVGKGQVIAEQPYLLPVDGVSKVAVITNGYTARMFDLNQSVYNPEYFLQEKLTVEGNFFVLTDTSGAKIKFYDFNPALPYFQQGQFASYTDPFGNVTEVVDHEASGDIKEVRRTAGNVVESFLYTYYPNAGMVQSVTLQRSTSGGSQGSFTTVRKAEYDYYADADTVHGNALDLKTVTIKDGADHVLDTTYYRYYTAADLANGQHGYVHGLKFVVNPESYARMAGLGMNPLSLTDVELAPYADNYFEYDSSGKATREIAQGAGCSACTGGMGDYSYAYYDRSVHDPSNYVAGINSWKVRTTETLPDGNENIVYTNNAGEVMLKVFHHHDTDGPNGPDTAKKWATYYRYDPDGRVKLQAEPSAVTEYHESYQGLVDQNAHQTGANEPMTFSDLADTAGLITTYSYYTDTNATDVTAGRAKGYLESTSIKQGETGTAIPQSLQTYFKHDAAGNTIFLPAAGTVYKDEAGAAALTTATAYTFFTGTQRIESQATTNPAGDTTTVVNDTYGRPIWTQDAAGFIDHTEYDDATGAATKTVVDVDTSHVSNEPTGWSSPSGTRLELTTTYEVDSLGRTTKLTDAAGNVTYTVYKDFNYEVRVYPGWNSTTHTPTGPTIVMRDDRANSYSEVLTMSVAPCLDDHNEPDGGESIGSLQSLSRTYYNNAAQAVFNDDYFVLTGLTYATNSTAILPLGTKYDPANPDAASNFYRTETGYDDRGRMDRTKRPDGTILRTVYDGLGRPISEWLGTNDTPTGEEWSPADPGNMAQQKEYKYDQLTGGIGDGNLTNVIDVLGRETKFTYDFRDRQTTLTLPDPDGSGTEHPLVSPVYATQYDNLDRVVKASDASGSLTTLGHYTTYAYDALNRAVTTTGRDADGSASTTTDVPTTKTMYDARGLVIGVTDPMNRTTTYEYDGAGRQTKVTQPDPNSTDSNPAPFTLYGYDGVGNLKSVIDPLSHETTYAYDKANRPTSVTPPDRDGNPNTVEMPTAYTYDDAGLRRTLADPSGNTTTFYYDALGRVTGEVDNSTNYARNYKYDGASRLLQKTDRDDRVTRYNYNLLDEVLDEKWYANEASYQSDPNSPSRTISFDYYADGQMHSATDPTAAQYDYVYDELGRLTTETQDIVGMAYDWFDQDLGWFATYRSQYNTDGSRSDLSADYGPDDTGNTDFLNHYTYDNLQRETSVTQQGGAGSYAWYKKFEFAYNAAGQFDKISAYHFGGQVAFYSDYLYDGMGRITQLTHTTNSTAPSLGSFGSGALAGHRYTYDDASRVASRTSTWRTSEDPADPLALGTVTYAYDHTNQLTGEDRDWALGDTGYTYDDSGNRTNYTDAASSVTYTIGAHNRLQSDDAGWTYGYDHEGNLTFKADADERYQYDYDHRNRLTKVTYSKDEGSGLVEKWHVDNSYDAFDRLVRRKDNLQQTEWPNLAGSDKVFSYEHGQIVLALEVYGTQTQRFLWGPKTDQLLATEYNGGYYGGGQIYFPLADAQGTITDAAKFWLENAQTQNYLTTVVMHRDIDAYGRNLSLQTFAAAEIGWQELTYAGPFFIFTGRYTDPLTGLQNNHHRWYAPDLGRWMNEDMFGLGPDFNQYRYVHNSPTNFTDPSGLAEPSPWAWNWHHMLDQAIFTPDLMTRHGLDPDMIHSADYGWMVRAQDHTGAGGIHPQGWSDRWNKWVKGNEEAGTKITKDMIDKQLAKMMKDFDLAGKGFPAKFCYGEAEKAYKAAERMARNAAADAAGNLAGKVGRRMAGGGGGARTKTKGGRGGGISGLVIGMGIALGAGYAFGSENPWNDALESLDPLDPSMMGDAEIPQWMRDQWAHDQWQRYQDELNQRDAQRNGCPCK